MYIITEGILGIGFSVMTSAINGSNTIFSIVQEGEQIIGDHYVMNKSRSNFIYLAQEKITAFAITRTYMYDVMIPNYKDFEVQFRSKSYNYYKKWIFRPIQQHRVKFLENQNRKRGNNRQVGKISSMGSDLIKSRDQAKLIHIPNPKLMSILGNQPIIVDE